MRFVSELKHLHLHSAKKMFYSPVDVKNKKKGAAIFMLTPNIESSLWITKLPYMYNPSNFISYYLPKNVTAYIDSNNNIDEDDIISEGLMIKNDKVLTLNFHNDYYYTARQIITDQFNEFYKEYCNILMVKDIPHIIDIYMYKDIDEMRRKTKIEHAHSFATTDSIHVVDVERYNGLDGTYKEYIRHEIASLLIKNINPKCHSTIIAYVAGSLSGQSQNENLMKNIDKIDAHGCHVVDRIYDDGRRREVNRMIRTNDPSLLIKYGWTGVFTGFAKIYYGESSNTLPDNVVEKVIYEGKLPAKERNKLPDSEFGIPSKRAYPLNDEAHVRSAIRMFNHVDKSDESLLASRIISKMKSMNIIDIKVSEENNFYKYYVKEFPNKIKESCTAPIGSIEELENQNYTFGKDFLRVHTEGADLITFFEDSTNSHDTKLRRYLYRERIRNNKQQIQIYNAVKAANPGITRTYLKFEQYMGYNLFVDLHYYNQLFLNNNIAKMDKAVNLYWDFMNRLLDNEEVNKAYSTKTYMIPIEGWSTNPDINFISDYKKSINPISVIFRMARTNPALLKEKWKNKIIIFVGTRGYFRVDFSMFELKNIPRMKNNLKKLLSVGEPIVDEEEIDSNEGYDDPDTDAALAAKMVDHIAFKSSHRVEPTAIVGPQSGIGNSTDISVSDFAFYNDKAVIKNPTDKKTNVFVMAPNTNSAESLIQNMIKNPAGIDGFIRLEK